MNARKINMGTVMIVLAVIALFVQSACTLRATDAAEKMKLIFHYPGHVGILNHSETCKAAKAMNINTFIMKASDGALESFLQTAATYGIDVIIMRSAWEKPLGNISLKYPNLIAWSIDDFVPSHGISPSKIKQWTDEMKSINPKLKFWPVLYYDVRSGLQYFMEANPYKPVLEHGTTMWLWSSYSVTLLRLDKLDNYLTLAKQMISPAYFATCVYPIQGGFAEMGGDMDKIFHHPDTVYKMVKMAYENSPGAGIFGSGPILAYYDINKLLSNNNFFGQQQNDDSRFDFRLGLRQRTVSCWYQAATATVSLPNNVDNASIYFRIRDNRKINSDYGKKFAWKQLVVNGKVVWGKSIYEDDDQTEEINKDIKSYLTGGTAKITIRMLAKCGAFKGDNLYVGGIALKVNNQTINTDFKFESGIKDFDKWVATYNAVKEGFSGSGIPGVDKEAVGNAGTLRLCDFSRIYTNPFGQSMVFGYRLPAQGYMSLRIYDMTGRLVTSLVNKEMHTGYHSAKWHTKAAAPGIYFINLKSGGQNLVKRIVGF